MPLPDKSALDMTAEEYRAARRQMRVDGLKAEEERRNAAAAKRLAARYGKLESKA